MPLKYNHTIFLVDDEESILKSLQRLLRKEGVEIITAKSGAEGLELLKKMDKRVSLFITDQRMPEMTGAEFLEPAKKIFPDAIRFLLTGYSNMDAVVDAVNKGSIHRYINKPWEDNDLLVQVRQALEQYELILENKRLLALTKKQNKLLRRINKNLEEVINEKTNQVVQKNRMLAGMNRELELSMFNAVRSFVSINEMYAPNFIGHGRRVSDIAREIAQNMGLPEKEVVNIEISSLLHDLGKIGLPQHLIVNRNQRLSHQDEALYKKHPERGQDMVKFINGLDHAGTLIKSHHEFFDGSGYPDQLREDMIPLGSRVIAIADAWDNMINLKENSEQNINAYLRQKKITQDDVSREELLRHAAIFRLRKDAFVKYDPDILKVFIKIVRKEGLIEKYQKIITVNDLREGMILAASLYTENGRFLLPYNTVLNNEHIKKLKTINTNEPVSDEIYIGTEG